MRVVLILVGILVNLPIFGQKGGLSDEKRKEFESQKVAYFTQELDLTPVEAAKFWPLYNEMQKKNRNIELSMRKRGYELKNAKGLKEDDFKESVGKMLSAEKEMLSIKEEYYLKLMAVVPPSKIWKLGEAERKFHRQLFDKLRKEPGSKHK